MTPRFGAADASRWWIDPETVPGRPARDALYRALRTHLHVHLRRARSAALAALAVDLPAAVLADLLDININTAIAWSTYAQTDWAVYLAARTRTTNSGSANDPNAIPVPVASAQE